MSGISAIYILDQKKRVLIGRDYRGELKQNVIEHFSKKLLEIDENTSLPLIWLEKQKLCFFYKRVNNVIIVLVSENNSNCIMMFSLIYKLVQVLTDYFKEIDEESIRDNFVINYELLDEIIDNGYPQTTESKLLSEFIKTEKYTETNQKSINKQQTEIAKTLTNVVSWRQPNIFYKKNQVFLDVVESVNMQINSQGSIIASEIFGKMLMKTQLSGMPELKLGINDKVMYEIQGRNNNKKSIDLNDLKFHSCVRLSKFENERVISFIPPDGEFELMTYRLEINVKPLIMVESKIKYQSDTKMELEIKTKSNFKQKCIANDVVIMIPIPCDSQHTVFETEEGKAVYNTGQECVQWNISQFQGNKTITMQVAFSLPSLKSENRDRYINRPIELQFEIPYFTVSGILIRYLKIEEKSNYTANPFVRYISKNGKYYIRTNYNHK